MKNIPCAILLKRVFYTTFIKWTKYFIIQFKNKIQFFI